MIELKLSQEELKYILESLLFSSSIDICADWYKEDISKMVEICKKLRLQYTNIPTENLYISQIENSVFSEENTEDILNYFPELKK
jgi:hypothetical protein